MNEHPNIAHENPARIEQCIEVLADMRYVVDECGDTARVFRNRFAMKDFIEQVMQGNVPNMMWLWAAPTAPQMAPAAVDPVCEPRVQSQGDTDVTADPKPGRQFRIVSMQEYSDDGGRTWLHAGSYCTCDSIGDGACPVHARENELQDMWLQEKAEVNRLRRILSEALRPNAKADLEPASGAQVQRLDGPQSEDK